MKVLVLSISTGRGHFATGIALEQQFQSMGVECKVVDAYEYIEPMLKELISKGYTFVSEIMPRRLTGTIYDRFAKKSQPYSDLSVTKMTNKVMAHELRTIIEEYDPDIVICTHVLSATLINILEEKNRIRAITVGVVTDFTLHPLWEDARGIDYYVTPSELLEYQMQKKGLDTSKMLPFGIPIQPKFSHRTPQKDAKIQLGLDPDIRTLLIMSGSMGYGRIDASIEKLDKLDVDFQALVVCGTNKRMKNKISGLNTKKPFHVYGFVDNVDLMMDASDCIITKPGGITTSEALAKGLPMVMVNPIPGHEYRNVEFMLNNGLALYATKTYPVDEAVFSLFKHPERIDQLRQTIDLYGKRNSTVNLCEFLIKQAEQANQAAQAEQGAQADIKNM